MGKNWQSNYSYTGEVDKDSQFSRGQDKGVWWDSEAADTFLAKFEKFKSNLEGYYQVVESYSKFLEVTAQAYSESDESINNLTANLYISMSSRIRKLAREGIMNNVSNF